VTQALTQAFVDAQTGGGPDRVVFDDRLSGFGLRVTPHR
jgi:hypothetical protein